MSSMDLSRDGLLDLVRRAWEEHDPVPDDLVARMQAVVAAEQLLADAVDLDHELLLLVERSGELAGARGTAAYTLRFSSDDVDLLLRAVPGEDGSARLDGWIAPATAMAVRAVAVAEGGGAWEAHAGDDGRFELVGLPPGMYRLFLTPADAALTPFGTPAFEI